MRGNTISSFKIEKTWNKFGYFIFFNVALYVFYTIILSDLVRNKTSRKTMP